MGTDLGWDTFWRLHASGAWEPHTRALIQRLQPGDVFVDIGAWIGPVTLWALERGAHVIAIEPDPIAADELRRRAPAAEIWEGALDTRIGHARIASNARDGGQLGDSMSRLSTDGVIVVQTWTLQDVLGDRAPALVKIDVEGHEAELLPTVAPWLAERGVPLQVSFHGVRPARAWFAGYSAVRWPAHPHDDLVALP
jgi:FkbM family methyltransferase